MGLVSDKNTSQIQGLSNLYDTNELTTYDNNTLIIPPHPLGIKPAGNAFTAHENLKSAAGYFFALPDELIVQILELLEKGSLLQLGATCKALYAFSAHDDLWKNFLISPRPSLPIKWRGTWRSTYLTLPDSHLSRIRCNNLFSDVLHRPFICAHTNLIPYTQRIPSKNLIPQFSNLSSIEYLTNWIDQPFILTDPVREWPVYRNWSIDNLVESYGNIKFRAEAVDWPLRTYIEYMNNQRDESPLYLFDRSFVEKMELSVGRKVEGHYWIPECFGEDFFATLGAERPDHRWLIIGPERSGSTFHKDPNATSAWNAVIRGSKYWIMFPSSSSCPPPPGVFVSEDQSEVTSPLSIAEWLLCFHAEARQTSGCMEGVCNAGAVLHVPSGWWHLVVNLSPSIAITQNFVPKAHLANVVAFLRDKPDQVSGFRAEVKNPYEIFVKRMEVQHSNLLKDTLTALEQVKDGKKRKWDQVIIGDGDHEEGPGGFSFGFGDGDGEEIP